MTLDYYKPDNFFIKNIAYDKHKTKFDHVLALFNESEDLKEEISEKKIKISTDEQNACSLIFERSQQLIISILRLSNEGNVEDSGILLRSLFENYVQMKYIIFKKLGREFMLYIGVAMKNYVDMLEDNFLDKDFIKSKEFGIYKEKIYANYNYVKNNFLTKKGKISDRWHKSNLRKLSADINEEKNYDFISKTYSAYVHCDIGGMENFMKIDNNVTVFDNSPSTEGIDIILNGASEFFGKIVVEWAALLCVSEFPDIFKKFIKKQN
jgi:hypothetical protein